MDDRTQCSVSQNHPNTGGGEHETQDLDAFQIQVIHRKPRDFRQLSRYPRLALRRFLRKLEDTLRNTFDCIH